MGLDRGTSTRVTFGGENDRPVWTRDGKAVIYSATGADGKFGLYGVAADGSAAPFLVRATEKLAVPMSVSLDGKTLLYRSFESSGRTRIFIVALSNLRASGEPKLLREGNAIDTDAEFSPDGRWIVFASTESGRSEIYLIPFPGPGGRIPVSRDGGRDPRWSRDGRELFFWPGTPGNTGLYAVSVKTTPSVEVGVPELLFKVAFGTTWGPAPDGKFLVEGMGAGGGVTGSTFATVTNWFEELKQRAPSKK
jgi:Tol biopolymer transport system component